MKQNLIEYFENNWQPKELVDGESFSYGICYVLYNRSSKRYKIGVTENLNQRVNKITTESGCIIDVVMTILSEGGRCPIYPVIEELLHKYYKSKRFLGEWFELDKKEAPIYNMGQE
ncbi:GIY-YIG nuclease family protein [Flagellimonas flava]|uniref:GIY-YIG nuclease family protein n=1 Tax=Flagellimonas flava TaxID=570519 RepID=UPI003D65DA81